MPHGPHSREICTGKLASSLKTRVREDAIERASQRKLPKQRTQGESCHSKTLADVGVFSGNKHGFPRRPGTNCLLRVFGRAERQQVSWAPERRMRMFP